MDPPEFFTRFILPGLIAGLWSAGLVAYGMLRVLPALRAAGARPLAIGAGIVLTALIPALAVADALAALPSRWLILGTIVFLLAVGSYPKLLVMLTGGPRPMEASTASLFAEVDAAQGLFERGDIEAWLAALERLDRVKSPNFSRYIDLLQRYAREEVARREGSRRSSRATLNELAWEANRVRSGSGPSALLMGATVALSFVVTAAATLAVDVPRGIASVRLCPDALDRVDRASWSGSGTSIAEWPISHLVLVEPPEPATLMLDGRLNLDGAAVSRHNPRARDLLVEHRFRDGYLRAWETPDGRLVQAEILVFESPQGAAAFHRAFTAYACTFSSQEFAGPADAVGLRVRYGTGDPIREQLTWVDGTMRVQVSRSFEAEPDDHVAILGIATLQLEQVAHPK